MNRIIVGILVLVALLVAGIFGYKFLVGGDKDTWVCKNGEWVKQGNPQSPMPTGECKQEGQISEQSPEVMEEKEVIFNQDSFEKNKQRAQEASENAPTYKFDGFELKYQSYQELECSDCWEFTFSFSSRHAGYGDRKGKILSQVITPHQIRVTSQEEKVTSVVTDRTFDELNQKFLK